MMITLSPSKTSVYCSPVTFGKWSEAKESVHAAELAHAVVRKKAVAHAVAHAPLPTYDYVRNRYTPQCAVAFSQSSFQDKDGNAFSGQDFLTHFLCERPIPLNHIPAVEGLTPFEFQKIGVAEGELRAFAKTHQVPLWLVDTALKQARGGGFLYEVRDIKRKATYYGVPLEVQNHLKLERPKPIVLSSPAGKAPAAPTPKTPMQESLTALFAGAELLAPTDEVFEFSAQLAKASLETGLIQAEDIPKALKAIVDKSTYTESLDGTLLNLLESAQGLPIVADIQEVCRLAESVGILTAKDLEENGFKSPDRMLKPLNYTANQINQLSA